MLDRPGTLEGAKLGDHRMFSCHAVEPTEGGQIKGGTHMCTCGGLNSEISRR